MLTSLDLGGVCWAALGVILLGSFLSMSWFGVRGRALVRRRGVDRDQGTVDDQVHVVADPEFAEVLQVVGLEHFQDLDIVGHESSGAGRVNLWTPLAPHRTNPVRDRPMFSQLASPPRARDAMTDTQDVKSLRSIRRTLHACPGGTT
ncbi:MAG: hypothetical protein ABW000_18785 [Actinoplanes sp.]